jgi:hypothetical protein
MLPPAVTVFQLHNFLRKYLSLSTFFMYFTTLLRFLHSAFIVWTSCDAFFSLLYVMFEGQVADASDSDSDAEEDSLAGDAAQPMIEVLPAGA